MGSKPVDSGTMKASSSGAQANDQALATNATQNQAFANQSRQSVFGNYTPGSGYSGGTESQFLNPSSLDQKGLSGSYLNQYNNEANQGAQTAQNAVGSTMQNMQNRGMGAAPAGFEADQQRKAYNDEAANQGNMYENAAGNQQSQAEANYANANNMLNSDSGSTGSLSLQGNNAAAGNYSNLYGDASKQKQSTAGALLSAGSGIAAGAAQGWAGKPCWIAAELFGGWDDPRTILVRQWICGPLQETVVGRILVKLYIRFGESMAKRIQTNKRLRRFFGMVFNEALAKARAWKGAK